MNKQFNYLTLVLLFISVTIPAYAWAQQNQNADKITTKNFNGIRFADQFNGSNGVEKQDAAIKDIGDGLGLVIVPPGTGPGRATKYSNRVPVIDLRQDSDIVGSSTTDPDRPPMILLEHHLGELTTKPLTGTVTLTHGSTAVRGVGTNFPAELAHHYGRSIKLDQDDTTSWARIASVQSKTEATLTVPYPGRGGSGPASYFITQLGFAVHNVLTAGTPNTMQAGEGGGFNVVSRRSGGERGVYGGNLNVTYDTPPFPNQGQALGLEVDLNNTTGSDDPVSALTHGLDVLSGGTNHPSTAIAVGSGSPKNAWLRGALITGWSQEGVFINGLHNHLQFFTGAPPNSDPQVGGRNAGNSAYIWNINNDGTAAFKGVTLQPTSVRALPPPEPSNAGMMARVSDSTAVSNEGQPCSGGSNHTALAFSDGTKWKCF